MKLSIKDKYWIRKSLENTIYDYEHSIDDFDQEEDQKVINRCKKTCKGV